MTNEEIIQKFKEDHYEEMIQELKEEGSIETSFFVGILREGEDKPFIAQIRVPFYSSEDKHAFLEEGLPLICKEINKKKVNQKLIFVGMITEAWMNSLNMKTNEKVEKEDVCIFIISKEQGDDLALYRKQTHDMTVGEDGVLQNNITLEKMVDLSGDAEQAKLVGGEFTGLYEKFNKYLK